MHQTKKVATPSAQTFLQPSAPIKSARHPAIATRHAPADPDTTHPLDPNSDPTTTQADDTRHWFRSRPVPAAPARTGSGHPPRARRRKGTTAPLTRSAFRSGHPHRRPGAPLRCRPEPPRHGPAKEQPRRLFRLFRPNRPLLPAPSFRAAFSLKPPQPRNPGDPPSGNIPGPQPPARRWRPLRTTAHLPLETARHRSDAPAATRHKSPQPPETPLAPPPARTPQTQHASR